MRKKIYLSLSFIITLLSLGCNTDHKVKLTKDQYRIDGVFTTTNNSTIYLVNDNNVKIDSSKIVDNTFSFQGKINTPVNYHLVLQNEKNKYPIILENSTYNVFIDNDKATVFGGKLNTSLNRFNTTIKELESSKIATLNTFLSEKISSKELRKKIDSIQQFAQKTTLDFITKNQENPLAIQVFNTVDISLDDALKLKKNTNANGNPAFQKKLTEKITMLEKIAKEELAKKATITASKKVYRRPALLFSGEGLNGNSVSLKNILQGKKAVLIDFWASWCGPCRAITPTVRRIYNQYKNKGFTILTVSEDKTKEAWKSGVAADNMLNWHHIFDDYGRISGMYGVRSIPYMVLIDGNGGIIKEKITITQLENELQKICK